MRHDLDNGILTLFLEGELNSYNAESVGKEINDIIKSNTFDSLVLDLDKLKYISSAGLRVILVLKQQIDKLSIINASLEVYDVFEMTGFTSMMDVKKALRKVDISKATIIGDGYFSTVYRLDKDTIVKVFDRTSDPQQIERELSLAKEAFILGVPTAISFDIVRVGEKLGVVFEMLDCMSLQNAVKSDLNRYPEYLAKYAELLKKINSTVCLNEKIPDIKKYYLKKIDFIKDYLEEKYYLKAKKLIESIENRKTFVHGDCHFKNIMVQNNDLILIDMDTLSVGHPIFELAAICAPYCLFNEDDPGNCEKFFGLTEEQSNKLYNDLLNLYFGKDDKVIKEKIRLLAYIHMVWWNRVNEPTNNVRLEGCRSRLYKLLDVYNDLNIGI